MTDTTTLTLTSFLLQRIAEDEAAARAATTLDDYGDPLREERRFYSPGTHRDDWGLWTFHVDPARVLAECEAKRRLVKYARSWRGELTGTADTPDAPPQAGYGDAVLRALAQVYRDHPDFNAHDWLI